MSEFADMLKEAFVGAPFDASPGRKALEASVRKYDKRFKAVRFMAWFAVTFMSAVAAWMAVLILRAREDTGARTLVLYAVVFVWAMLGVGLGKMWFAMMLNQIAVMKELKLVQMMLVEHLEQKGQE